MCVLVNDVILSLARRRLVVLRKCVSLSAGGVDGVQPIAAKCGRRMWKRRRISEFLFVAMSNSPRSVGWSKWGVESGWRVKPVVAFRCAVAMLRTKSGTARVRGDSKPRPPWERPSWLMRVEWVGRVSRWSRRERNKEMMSSVAAVSGPFHSSHGGLSMSVGRW